MQTQRWSLHRERSLWFSSVAQLCLPLCNPIGCSTPGFPVHHQLLVLAQTNVHRAGDAIQPSHPQSSTPLAFNLSQHQDLFQGVLPIRWPLVSALASALPRNIQEWLPLGWTGLIFLQSEGLSRVFSNTTVQTRQLFSPKRSLRPQQLTFSLHVWRCFIHICEKIPDPWKTFTSRENSLMFILYASVKLFNSFALRNKPERLWLWAVNGASILGLQRREFQSRT